MYARHSPRGVARADLPAPFAGDWSQFSQLGVAVSVTVRSGGGGYSGELMKILPI